MRLKDQLARALADYSNLVKRIEREKEGLEKTANIRLILKMLPILDVLESAQEHLKDQGLGVAVAEFKKILNEEGLIEIKPQKGEKFDHGVHEAVESVLGGKKGGVAELVMSGWTYLGGPVVRVAKVKVYGERVEKKKELEKELQRGEYV